MLSVVHPEDSSGDAPANCDVYVMLTVSVGPRLASGITTERPKVLNRRVKPEGV